MKLYGTVHAEWRDPWGGKHYVDKIVQVVDVVPAGTFPHNNGYATTNNSVFVDGSGATYLSVPPIDFGASGHYLRNPPSVNERTTWRTRPPARCINEDGTPYTATGRVGRWES